MRLAVTTTLALTMLTVTAEAEPTAFLCIADRSTGFHLEDKQWVSGDFKVEKFRFIVKAVPERQGLMGKVNYEVSKFGDDGPLYECYREDMVEQVACGGLGMGFLMNFRTLRFQDYYGHGYLTGEDDRQNTPSLTIGKCTPL